MDTVLTSYFPVSEAEFRDMMREEIEEYIEEYMEKFETMYEEIQALYQKSEGIVLLSDQLIYDSENSILFPMLDKGHGIIKITEYEKYKEKSFLDNKIVIKGQKSYLPTLDWLQKRREIIYNLLDGEDWVLCNNGKVVGQGGFCYYNLFDNIQIEEQKFEEYGTNLGGLTFPVMSIEIESDEIIKFLDYVCKSYRVFPKKASEKTKQYLSEYYEMEDFIWFEDGFVEYAEEILDYILSGKKTKVSETLYQGVMDIVSRYDEERRTDAYVIDSKDILLNCEKIRADIEPYEEKILTDPNRGHWDLWNDKSGNTYTVKMDKEFVARNPKCDINEDGVIAIDFGTKSTIVVYQSDIEHSLPMGIGDGNLSKEPSPKRYENPTVMQFVNLEKFLQDYNSSEGRPETVWEDLPISHTAMDKFSASKSEEYYAFLHQIKQWAGQREKQFRIQPIKGKSLLLPSFMDLKEDDINPIEIYAYYIGLYINNMRKGHGIFLDYYLSFPVTYEMKIRQKIVQSFEKGLKKSLPISVQRDEEIMSRFRVNGEISEPAAYAVCALQEYGFDPKGDEEFFYGIFDFGGGTTDFDFGLWKESGKKRYDYCIENFGGNGDKYLGGENLLEMLAFEIFKENQKLMRENNYTFTLAPKSKEFLGSDALLSDSQEAEKNMHNLMEVLRPYWERDEKNSNGENNIKAFRRSILQKLEAMSNYNEIVEAFDKIESESAYNLKTFKARVLKYLTENNLATVEEDQEEEIILKVSLFDKEGKDHPNVALKTTREFIYDFIEEKIREGVKNFFAALKLSYQNDRVKKPTKVNILLAGNSCKSPIVKKVFEEEIEIWEKEINEKYKEEIEEQMGKGKVKFFEIFPPLGTEEAYEKMRQRGISCAENDFEKPTGKTGVAFGLIQCREGGVIERINTKHIVEIPFQYFLGWQSKKRFEIFSDEEVLTTYKGKPDYNKWYKFIEADADTFYLYYTTLPECANGDLLVEGNAAVKRIKCTIDKTADDAYVYIRAISPYEIEYAVSSDRDVEVNIIGKKYSKRLN